MIKVLNLHYKETFWTNKDELIRLLFSEIIFLTRCLVNAESEREKSLIRIAIKKFEFLVEIIDQSHTDISNKDFNKFVRIISQTIRDILNNLQEPK